MLCVCDDDDADDYRRTPVIAMVWGDPTVSEWPSLSSPRVIIIVWAEINNDYRHSCCGSALAVLSYTLSYTPFLLHVAYVINLSPPLPPGRRLVFRVRLKGLCGGPITKKFTVGIEWFFHVDHGLRCSSYTHGGGRGATMVINLYLLLYILTKQKTKCTFLVFGVGRISKTYYFFNDLVHHYDFDDLSY